MKLRNGHIAPDALPAFASAIRASKAALKVEDADIARWFRLPVITVTRWTQGIAAPTEALRRRVLEELAERIDAATAANREG